MGKALRWGILLLCILGPAVDPVAARSAAPPESPVRTIDLLPAEDELPGWKAGERRTISSARGLYDYMDGGAEIYLDYGFQDLAVGEWTSPDGDPLKVEVYRMGRPKSAYGMFTQDTWGDAADVGQGAQIQGGTLRFWKGSYFVRVFMWRGYKENSATIMETGRSVAARIKREGELPALVSVLPVDSRVEGGLHFFHTALTLDAFYYLSDDNPLALSGDTDGVIGEYMLGEDTVFLIVVSYPDGEGAGAAFENFVRAAGTGAELRRCDPGTGRDVLAYEDGGLWRKVVKWNSYLTLAMDGPSADSCDALIAGVEANLENCGPTETGEKKKSDSSD